MGGGGTQQTTSTTGPSNPNVTATQNKLLTGLQSTYDAGVKPFEKSLYAGAGDTTQSAWNMGLGSANQPAFTSGISGAMTDFGEVAAGNRFGMDDPGYAALRAKAGQDTLRDVGSAFTSSGRFGGGSYVDQATESLGNVYAGMDYQNYQNDIQRQQQAAQMLPGLYGAAQLPASAMGAIGAAQDQDSQAQLMAENDLFRRTNDVGWDRDARASSVLAGTAAGAGQETTNIEPATPWWQTMGAGALGLGAMFL